MGKTVSAMSRAFAHLSDEAVIALIARSDEQALGELYDRFGRVAYGLALRILRDDALAEDAVQEAVLSAWRRADTFMPERAKASTWLLTIVQRRAALPPRSHPRGAAGRGGPGRVGTAAATSWPPCPGGRRRPPARSTRLAPRHSCGSGSSRAPGRSGRTSFRSDRAGRSRLPQR